MAIVIEAKYKPKVKFTKDTPYFALMGELLDVNYEALWENWLHYNGTTLCLILLWQHLFPYNPS